MDCGGVFVKYVLFIFNILFVVRKLCDRNMYRIQKVKTQKLTFLSTYANAIIVTIFTEVPCLTVLRRTRSKRSSVQVHLFKKRRCMEWKDETAHPKLGEGRNMPEQSHVNSDFSPISLMKLVEIVQFVVLYHTFSIYLSHRTR